MPFALNISIQWGELENRKIKEKEVTFSSTKSKPYQVDQFLQLQSYQFETGGYFSLSSGSALILVCCTRLRRAILGVILLLTMYLSAKNESLQ